jgi:hypothetical protein
VGSTGARICPACPVGTYSDVRGLATCLRCQPGTFNALPQQSNCTKCAAGYAQPEEAQLACLICPPGRSSLSGAARCSACGERTVAPSAGSTTCYGCDQNSISNADSTVCLCNIGFAAQYNNASDGSASVLANCVRCPEGAVCDAVGTEWNSMLTQPGFWSAQTGEYYRCLVATQCVGNAAAANPAQCKAHYTGPLCSYCENGYSQSVNGDCNPCNSATNSAGYTALIVIIFIGAVIACLYVNVRSGENLMDIASIEEERMRREQAGYQTEKFDRIIERNRHGNIITLNGPPAPHPDFTFKLKILLGFLQVCTNLSFGLAIQFPPTFTAFLNWFNPVCAVFTLLCNYLWFSCVLFSLS